MSGGEDLDREYEFFTRRIDPLVRQVLEARDPWDAYGPVNELAPAILSEDFPDSGGIYVAWMELADLFEIGRSSIEDSHAALREAAHEWLLRPKTIDPAFLSHWTDRAQALSGALFERDGNTVWRPKPE